MTHRDNSEGEDSFSLTADKRAEEYFSKQEAARRANNAEMELDPAVAKEIDDVFDAFARVYIGDSEFEEAFGPKDKA